MFLKDRLAGIIPRQSLFDRLVHNSSAKANICRAINTSEVQPQTEGINRLHKTLEYAGVALTKEAAAAIRVWPRVSEFASDPRIRDNLADIITELKKTIEILKKALDDQQRSEKRKSIGDALEHLKTVLSDLKETKNVLVTTAFSQGPSADTLMTTYLGAVIGPCFGIAGAASGAAVGAAVGMVATRAGILGNFVQENRFVSETESSDSDD